MLKFIEYQLRGEGYSSISDFLQSCFHVYQWKPILGFAVSLGAIASIIEKFIGLEPVVYLAFILLLGLEFWTGVRVSVVKKKQKFTSKRFGRFFTKIMAYTILIGVINIFKNKLPVPNLFDTDIAIFSWVYYTGLTWVILQLIVSVFENFGKLGWTEAKGFAGVVMRKFNQLFDLDNESDGDHDPER
jgi:hypothetical protein